MGDLFGPTFKTVVMDPPWPERGGGKIVRGCQRHYGTVNTLDDLERVVRSCPHWERIDATAHLYCWTTNRFLAGGAYGQDGAAWGPELCRRLGFRPITVLTWAKMEPAVLGGTWIRGQKGIGQYFRGETEQIVFAVRGDGMRLRRQHTERRDLGGLILAPVPRDERGHRIHSRKPDESYRLIEAASPGPYLELFARRAWSPEWTTWGEMAPTDPSGSTDPAP